ncbi:MAG TPA: hypothetical protein ENN80_03295 [Candidatus Hydrogenedentes bacterium]|nr:hypothetical protein [Candidatus Hydrogenedentota bacterium]
MKLSNATVGLVLCVVAGCGTASVPFVHMKPKYTEVPLDTLREVALRVEQAIQAGEREPDIPDRDGIVLNTDLIRQAIRMRAARSEHLNAFLDQGYAVEKRNGHVYILRTKEYQKATTGRERNRNAQLILGEAENRWAIYEGIVDASDLPKRSLSAIQEVFHEARLKCMKPGQKYENAQGDIVPIAE